MPLYLPGHHGLYIEKWQSAGCLPCKKMSHAKKLSGGVEPVAWVEGMKPVEDAV